MCRVDLSIAGRGLQKLWGHWNGCGTYPTRAKVPHHDAASIVGQIVSARFCRGGLRLDRMVEPPVYLESPISLSLEERVALKREVEEEGSRPVLPDGSAAYLWLCFFLNCFGAVTGFQSLMRLMDGCTGSLLGEMELCSPKPYRSEMSGTIAFCVFFTCAAAFWGGITLVLCICYMC